MPTIVDPSEAMRKFQKALKDGVLTLEKLEKAEVDPTLSMLFDAPRGVRRLTFARINAEGTVTAFAIVSQDDAIENLNTQQIGYAVPPEFQGKGYAKKIVEATIAEVKFGLNRAGHKAFWITAIVGADNIASQRVAEAVISKEGERIREGLSGKPAIRYRRKIV